MTAMNLVSTIGIDSSVACMYLEGEECPKSLTWSYGQAETPCISVLVGKTEVYEYKYFSYSLRSISQLFDHSTSNFERKSMPSRLESTKIIRALKSEQLDEILAYVTLSF
jgi:hypothetical protein